MSTLNEYEQASFAVVEMNGSRTPAVRRKVNSACPWAIFIENQLIRFSDAEMMLREAVIVGGGSQEDGVELRKKYEAERERSEKLQSEIRRGNEQIRNLEKKIKVLRSHVLPYATEKVYAERVYEYHDYPKSVLSVFTAEVPASGKVYLKPSHTYYGSGAEAEVAIFSGKGQVNHLMAFKRGTEAILDGLPPGPVTISVAGFQPRGWVRFPDE